MVQFIFKTMTQRSASVKAAVYPYYVYLNQPFEVTEKADIEWFDKNSRFERAGKVTAAPQLSAEDEFIQSLMKIKGVKKATAEKLTKMYRDKNELKVAIDSNFSELNEIGEKQLQLIKNHYGG